MSRVPGVRMLRCASRFMSMHGGVEGADEQKRRHDEARERRARQIRPTASRDDRADVARTIRRRNQRGRSAGARPEQTNRQGQEIRLMPGPVDHRRDAMPEQCDVESVTGRALVERRLGRRQQIDQERAEPVAVQPLGDKPIARTSPVAAAAVRKDNQPARCGRDGQVSLEHSPGDGNANRDRLQEWRARKRTR